MNNILVTGGAGYIGSYFVKQLLKLDFNVTVVDNLMFNQNGDFLKKSYENLNFINGDVRDEKLIKKIVNKNDIIIPLAGIVGAPLSEKMPKETKEINQDAIKYLTSICSKEHLIIMPVSNSGYGIGEKDSFCDENSPLKPISLYGKTKVESEKIIMDRENSISFRLATVFGVSEERMRTDLMVNNFTYLAYKKEEFKIYEPNFRRNFVHISDISEAFLFSIRNFSDLKSNIFNLGLNNANITKIQLCEKIKKYLPEFKFEISHNKKDPDQRDYFVSNEKLKKAGFEAKFSLDKGIQELIKYFTDSSNDQLHN
jgi:nucleoside-diphosphate-sugar epimerase